MARKLGVDVDALDAENDSNRVGTVIYVRRDERRIRRIGLQCLLQFLDGMTVARGFNYFVDAGKPVSKDLSDNDNLVVLHITAV